MSLITGLSLVDDFLVFNGRSAFAPLRPDTSAMSCTGSSPFDYRAVFNGALSDLLSSEALRCDGLTAFTNIDQIVGAAPSPSPTPTPPGRVPEPGVMVGLGSIAVALCRSRQKQAD